MENKKRYYIEHDKRGIVIYESNSYEEVKSVYDNLKVSEEGDWVLELNHLKIRDRKR